MISRGMSRPAQSDHGPRSGPLETSGPRRHHEAARYAVPTSERTMSPVRCEDTALVGEAAIREHSGGYVPFGSITSASHPGTDVTVSGRDGRL